VVFHPNSTGGELRPQVIASDGRPYRDQAGQPARVEITRQNMTAGNPHAGLKAFIISSAERYDVLLNTAQDPAPPGVYPVEIEFRKWQHPHGPITPDFAPFYKARTTITIT
jgi:hypothetical protein